MSVTLHTDLGDIKIELFCEYCPKTCENFLGHCAKGTYNDTKILRNIKEFMVQMGDPTNKGKGGESIWGGYIDDEIRPAIRHSQRGMVSMANSGPNTNGSQFFITYGKQVSLDGKYTVFGRVIWDGPDENDPEKEGSTLEKLENLPVDKKFRPKEPVWVKSVTIHANPIAEKA